MSKKIVISAALCGSATMKDQNPAVPYTPEEYAEEVERCYEAGAAIVHLHIRDPVSGIPTADLGRYEAVLGAIKEKCPRILINLSSSIGRLASTNERIKPVKKFQPDLASLNTNTMNLALGDWHTGEIYSEAIFENQFRIIQHYAKTMRQAKVKPEIEVYDFGGMYNIIFLQKSKLLDEPMHFQFVFGVLGGIPFTFSNLAGLLALKPSNATWSVCGVAKQQFQAGMCAAAMGGHVRVGLEDNIRTVTGKLAKGSWEQVEWAVKVAKIAGREIASPGETRKIFHLYK